MAHVGSNNLIPAITVRRTFSATYMLWDGNFSKRIQRPKSNKSSGRLSAKAKQRLTIAIELLIDAAQTKRIWWSDEKRYVSFKVNFITLTLPSKQEHTDSYIVANMLKPLLRWWRDKNPSLLYIWKAEVQDNGNIHFHLTTNSFIHWRTLRKKWNGIAAKHGYIARSKSDDPNSTDVHGVRNIKDLAGYITGYVAKKDLYTKKLKRFHRRYDKVLKALPGDVYKLPVNYFSNIKRELSCKLWDASKLLLEGPCRVQCPGTAVSKDLEVIWQKAENVKDVDYCKVYSYKKELVSHFPGLNALYQDHIKEIRARCKTSEAILI